MMTQSAVWLRRCRFLLLLASVSLLTVACGGIVGVTPSSCSGAPGSSVSYDIEYQGGAQADTTNGQAMISIDVPVDWTVTSATYDVNGTPAGAATQSPSDPVCADVPQGPIRPGYKRIYFTADFPAVAAGPSSGTLHVTFDTGATPPGAYYIQFYGAGRDDATPAGTCSTFLAASTWLRYVIGNEIDVPISVASLFNSDVIVNEVAGVIDPAQQSVGDSITDNRAFPTQSVADLLSPGTGDGLPDDGSFVPFCAPPAQLEYSNADNGNNARRSENSADTFTFNVPPNAYEEIHLYGAYGGGASDRTPVAVTLTYADGSSTVTTVPFRSWAVVLPPDPSVPYTTPFGYPLIGGRDAVEPVDTGADGFDYADDSDRLIWGVPVESDPARQLVSVTVTRLDIAGVLNFFGATGVLINQTDVAIAKARTDGGVFMAGSDATYTLTVSNLGAEAAQAVAVRDVLPAELQFVSVSASQGSCTEAGGTIDCNLGSMAAGTTATVTIVARPATAGSITNTATVSAASPESDFTNNTATVTESALPAPSADLTIAKALQSAAVVTVGVDAVYRITVTNSGPDTATNVVVEDPVPTNSAFVSASPSQGTCSNAAGTITCALGALAIGGTATVDVVFDTTATGSVVNVATVSADQADPVPGDNLATAPAVTVADAESIPALSTWMLGLLAAMLAAAAIIRLSP